MCVRLSVLLMVGKFSLDGGSDICFQGDDVCQVLAEARQAGWD